MAEDLFIIKGSKEEQYKNILPQIRALVSNEEDLIANMANIAAALKEQFNFLWVGFYLVKDEQLILGPFQGPVACTRIQFNKGVCGTSWALKKTIIVPNVDEFHGHIACSSISKSEIVLPLFKNNEVFAILDVDSEMLAAFDETDKKYLREIIKEISNPIDQLP